MDKYRNNWYYIGGIIFVALAFVLVIWGEFIDPLHTLMIGFYMTLLVHQYEEYAVPGGFPTSWNTGFAKEVNQIDRYPLNTKSAFIVNICCAYPIYIIGIILGHIHVVGIFMAYFSIAQVIVHCGVINKKLGTVYNPGVASALLLMLPLGCYYLWFTASNFDLPAWNWWVPLLAFPFISFATILLPVLKCQDKNTTYSFSERDSKGFSIKGKVARIRR